MTNVETNEEEELRETKYPHLRVLTGGGNPPEEPSEDYISKLQKGAVFSCKDKLNNGMVLILQLVFKHPKTYVLVDALGNNPRMAADADFCKRFKLLEVIEEGGERPEEVTDGNDTRTIRPTSVADDADAEGRQPRDGED